MKNMVMCLVVLIAVTITGCQNQQVVQVVEAAAPTSMSITATISTTPRPIAVQRTTVPPTKITSPTPLSYVECQENGEGMICFGDYYKELPSTAWENTHILPEYIILHWSGKPAKPYDRWLSESVWYGLAGREDGGRSAHFGVGRDGIGQFLPMYQGSVSQSRAASTVMDKKCINIEIAGEYFDVIVTGGVEEGYIEAIEEVSDITIVLVAKLMDQYNIPLENILGHYQVLEGKRDPGELWLQDYFLPKLKEELAE